MNAPTQTQLRLGPVVAAFLAVAAILMVASPVAESRPLTAEASKGHSRNWCKTATVRIDGDFYWPYGNVSCAFIMRNARPLLVRNRRPSGWRCKRYVGSQPYGSCSRGDRYFGFTVPH